MRPEQGNIFVADDVLANRMLVRRVFERSNFKVFDVATMPDAREIIPRLGEMGVKVAILDGNVDRNSEDSADGTELNEMIKALYGDQIVTIGYSGSDDIEGADFNLRKPAPVEDMMALVEQAHREAGC